MSEFKMRIARITETTKTLALQPQFGLAVRSSVPDKSVNVPDARCMIP